MFASFLVRFRIPLLLAVLALAGVSFWQLPRLEISHDISLHYPTGDPDYEFYQKMTAALGDEDDLLVVAIRREGGIFDSLFLQKVEGFASLCDSMPQVLEVRSLTRQRDVVNTAFGLFGFNFLTLENPKKFPNDSLWIARDYRLKDRFISGDFKTLVVMLKIEKGLRSKEGERFIAGLEKTLAGFAFEEAHIAGRKYFEVSVNRMASKELKKSALVSLCILVVLLGWLYRSFWGVFLPVMVFALGMICYLGYHAVTGRPLTFISNLFPPILLIATLSDVIHILSKYEENLLAGSNQSTALRHTLHQTGLSVFLTSLVTAVGFWSFLSSPLPSARSFGLDMGVGVMLVYLVTIGFLPAMLLFLKPKAITTNAFFKKNWERTGSGIFHFVSKKGWWAPGLTLLVVLAGVTSLFFIETNTTVIGSWHKDHPLQRSADFFEKHLAGTRTLEIALTPKNGHSLGELTLLREVDKVRRHLDGLRWSPDSLSTANSQQPIANNIKVGGVYSPACYFISFHKSLSLDHLADTLPANQATLDWEEKTVHDQIDFQYRRVLNAEKTFGKISARMTDPGNQAVKSFNREIENWIAANADTSLLAFRITGASLMADLVHEHSIRNILQSFPLSFLLVGLLMLLIFRHWRTVGVILLVNTAPIFLTLAAMAAFGIQLRYGTSIIFNIVFVLAVDDTIHFMTRYRQERATGKPPQEILPLILSQTGKPMVMTTVLVVGGSAILMLSEFRDAFALGILMAFTSVGALLADLFLSPWLLLRLDRSAGK